MSWNRTLQSDAVHGEGSGQLSGNLHASADEGLAKDMLESFIEVWTVSQLADHRDGILRKYK